MNSFQNERLEIIAFGGGTGMPHLLRGLRGSHTSLTAVVVVSDDGGSSGELRTLYNMPAPGDLRNVIVALGEAEQDFLDLLQFRFDDHLLAGHSLGNLVLAALTRLKGGFQPAVDTLCHLAQVRGKVIPATFEKVALVATHQDGSKSTGEVRISQSNKPIVQVTLKPEPQLASDELLKSISAADVILLGPGSLFTSVIPHLLVPGVTEAIQKSQAQVIYIANIMTQPGETTDFDLKDHIAALRQHGLAKVDAILAHNGDIPSSCMKAYQEQGARPVLPQKIEGITIWVENLLGASHKLRHHPESLAQALLNHMKKKAAPVNQSQAKVRIENESGLHTRPASQIVKLANRYQAEITVSLRDQTADARSIMDLILLTATRGCELEILAQGQDADEAVRALVALVNNNFQPQVMFDGNT